MSAHADEVEEVPFATEVVGDESTRPSLTTTAASRHPTGTVAREKKRQETPIVLSISLFLRNGFSEAEAVAKIRELGQDLDLFTYDLQYGTASEAEGGNALLSALLSKDLIEVRLLAYDSRKDLSQTERVLLKNLFCVLTIPGQFSASKRLLQSLGYAEVFDAVLLTYLAGGFGLAIREKHKQLATHYGCQWEERSETRQIFEEQAQWTGATFYNCQDEKKCYCADVGNYQSEIYAYSETTKQGHIAVLCLCCEKNRDICVAIACLPLVLIVVSLGCWSACYRAEPVVQEKDKPLEPYPYLACFLCGGVRYDPITVTKTLEETKRVAMQETIIESSSSAPAVENLSDQFLMECRSMFVETAM